MAYVLALNKDVQYRRIQEIKISLELRIRSKISLLTEYLQISYGEFFLPNLDDVFLIIFIKCLFKMYINIKTVLNSLNGLMQS